MYKAVGLYITIVSILLLKMDYAMADSFTFPNWQTVIAESSNWFATAAAWGANLATYATPAQFYDAVIAGVNNDPAHIAAGATASLTSGWMVCLNGQSFSTVPPPPTTPPAPPAPVVTSSTSGASCTYISWYSPLWSDCSINSNWTTAWNINCLQVNTWQANYATASWSCTTTYVDGVSSGTSCDGSCPADASRPATQTEMKTVSIYPNSPTSTCDGSQYANNNDSCKVSIGVYASTNQSRWITNWWANGNIASISDTSGEKSDRIGNTGNALNFTSVASAGIPNSTPASFTLDITGIRSVSPFVSNVGKIAFNLWGVGMNVSNIPYHFRKPFTGKIETSTDNGSTWNASPKLWTEMLYRIWLNQKSTLTWNGLSGYALGDFSSAIQPYGNGLDLQSKSIINPTLTSTNGAEFKARINTSASASSLNKNPWLQINLPVINYILGGQTVKYQLSEQDAGNDTTSIKTSWSEFLWVRVIGGIQWAGKSEFTGQKANISNISTSDMRTKIRQNAYAYIANMQNGQVVNGVKYVIGDITISGDQSQETLVVKDGNVIINGNLNELGKKFWIIVMKDGYNLNSDYAGKWNVYITPGVTKINAVIYADGWFISADSSKNPYTTDSSTRTSALQNQLFMNGSLFTRNTIGWAILAGGKYVLPGWSTLANTDANFNKAMVYDLNYIRRWSALCVKDSGGNCIYKEPFVIKYDSRMQTSPVKLFSR